ncbi:hypothetical protein LCGC14_2556390 [marine sediment metagenome]|uniref:Uncharacterized protein n=1 Tax=marine sediment metagenome TaxID=412755 RepID=A0A0F9CXM1_9ZZZZ
MYHPDNFIVLLEQAGQSGVLGWPQLKPACKWAAEEIIRLRQEAAVIAKIHEKVYKLFKKE